jgi:hypothetical protein
MAEAEWLAANDPAPMLELLRDRGKMKDRKLRLFAVACCRHIWPLIREAHCREAVEIAERFADGSVTAEVQEAARIAAERIRDHVAGSDAPLTSGADFAAAYAVSYAVHDKGTIWPACRAAVNAACAAGHAISCRGASEGEVAAATFAESAAQAALARDLFGNPFRPAPTLAPAVVAWNGGTVPKLAAAIYEERAFDRLPVLADALEDAGCTDADVLGHCRGGGEHVRGCWVVDLVLGKG